jgi:cyanophycin synthetase
MLNTLPILFKLCTIFSQKLAFYKHIDLNKLENSYYIKEAQKLGINSNIIMDNVLQLRKGDEVYNIWQSGTDLDGLGSLHVSGDKAYCYSMFEKIGIPTPKHAIFKSGDYKSAIDFKNRMKSPIVIKPARDTGDSKGVFIKPETFREIFRAVNIAGAYGREILVEKYFEGTNYRLLFCKGRFLGASARVPASIVCDGFHSIKEMIVLANKGRLQIGDIFGYEALERPILYEIRITRQLKKVIRKQGLRLSSIVGNGRVVQLHDTCHWLYGGQYLDVTDEISPVLVDVCRKGAEAIGIKLAGVDMIAQDIKEPREETYVINEINTTPALLIHYEVQNQEKRRNVARMILETMFHLT